MRAARLVLLLLGSSVALPSAAVPAAADGEARLARGPVVAGEAVVWAEASPGSLGGIHVLRLARPGSAAIELYRSEGRRFTDLAASGSLVGFSRAGWVSTSGDGLVDAVDALIGPPTGPFRELVPSKGLCSLGTLTGSRKRGGELLASVDVDGTVVAYTDPECAGVRVRVARVEPVTGSRTDLFELQLPKGCCPDVAVGGRFVAWSEPDDAGVTLYDFVARRIVTRIRPADREGPFAFDVAADGKIAVLYRPRGALLGRVVWRSPSQPRGHVVTSAALPPDRGGTLRFEGGRLAFQEATATSSGRLSTAELVVVDARGRRRRTARFDRLVLPPPAFDLGGSRIAWESPEVERRALECSRRTGDCYTRETGTTTLRVANLPRAVRATEAARLPLDRRAPPPWRWRELVSGPSLVGGGVAWVDYSGAATAVRVWGAHGSRVVHWGGGSLASSGDAIALGGRDVLAGTLDQRLRLLPYADCRQFYAPRHPGVDDGVVASIECERGRPVVVLHDLRRRRRLVLGPKVVGRRCCSSVRLAGRYVAWIGFNSTVVSVYDRARGRVAYRAYLRGRTSGFDLQRDGKLVVLGEDRIVWFSPEEPRPHEFPFPRGERNDRPHVDAEDDRVALLHAVGEDAAVLRVVGLGGRARTLVRLRGWRTRFVGGVAFDGRRLTWATERITRVRRPPCTHGDAHACSGFQTGAFTIWVLDVSRKKSRPRAVVHVPFRERPG